MTCLIVIIFAGLTAAAGGMAVAFVAHGLPIAAGIAAGIACIGVVDIMLVVRLGRQ